MKKSKKLFIWIPTVILVLLITMLVFMVSNANHERKKLYYSGLEASKVADGVYRGSADTSLVKAEVEVTVQNHTIKGIDLLRHENGLGTKAEAIIKDMVSQNTYEVDAISGATLSSEVIKSAVSIALEKGKVQ